MERNIGTLTIHGNNLCCNFVNTVYAWRGKNLHEYLGSYEDFINWCRKLNVGNARLLNALLMQAKQSPAKAANALKEIKKTRLFLYNFIAAIAAKDYKIIQEMMPPINKLLAKANAQTSIELEADKFELSIQAVPGDLLTPVWIVLQSLTGLLIAEDINRLKECPRCGWVFVDRTKNGKRIWCAPAECGSADKMQRYNAKQAKEKKQVHKKPR